jgi:hypothetical protein
MFAGTPLMLVPAELPLLLLEPVPATLLVPVEFVALPMGRVDDMRFP